jgi:hypothetical protein
LTSTAAHNRCGSDRTPKKSHFCIYYAPAGSSIGHIKFTKPRKCRSGCIFLYFKRKSSKRKEKEKKTAKIIKSTKNHHFGILKVITHANMGLLIAAIKRWLKLSEIMLMDTFLDMKNIKIDDFT